VTTLQEILPNVFTLRGFSRFAPGFRITKTMTIVKHGAELTLINSAIPDADDLEALDKLGKVRHVMRIGTSHGLDDPFFIDRYKPTYWTTKNVRHRGDKSPDQHLTTGDNLPFAGKSMVFEKGLHHEAAVVVDVDGGLLVTCDSLMAWRDTKECSLIGKIAVNRLGFLKAPVAIGPIWLKQLSADGKHDLRSDFERLLDMSFTRLIGGHGVMYEGDTKDQIRAAIARQKW
jgi:hypothetical protein